MCIEVFLLVFYTCEQIFFYKSILELVKRAISLRRIISVTKPILANVTNLNKHLFNIIHRLCYKLIYIFIFK